MRHGREGGRDRLRTRFAAAGLVLAAGGCSADVARFDFPTFSLNNDGSGAAPRPSASVRAGAPRLPDDPLRPEGAAQGRGDGDVRIAALPEPSPSELPPAGPAAFDPRRIERRPLGAAEAGAPQRGVEIEVQPGDTLYALSKRHRVSLSELMAVNELAAPSLKPGQRIYLPAGHAPARPLERSRAPEVASARHVDDSLGRPAASSTWSGTYTVRPGDSVYAVARRYNVSFAELQQANAITDARRVRPGTVLKVPGAGRDAPLARGRDNAAPQLAPEAAPPIPSTTQPTIINGATRVAALPSLNDASPAPSQPAAGDPMRREEAPSAPNGEVRLRWPVSGRVIAAFGPRSDGTHNDGLNLAVPLGTDVHAAEAGLVAYSGNELKGYGNLVLLRHDNGWVTAYAHNDELLVKRGDKVKRGQVLARAGKTGQVDQPQVHFELRQGSKPVDPTPFLERL